MPNANYCVVGSATQGGTGTTSAAFANILAEAKNGVSSLALKTVNAVRIATVDNNQDNLFDSFSANVAIFC